MLRFGTSHERRRLLRGFLRFRRELHAAGLAEGFQWINGSFVEDIERRESRPPRDLDVVTFFELPAGDTQVTLQLRAPLTIPTTPVMQAALKLRLGVDAYWVHLGAEPGALVERSTYWYSIWSHRRNGAWKGFLQLDLSPSDDPYASELLRTLDQGGEPQ